MHFSGTVKQFKTFLRSFRTFEVRDWKMYGRGKEFWAVPNETKCEGYNCGGHCEFQCNN